MWKDQLSGAMSGRGRYATDLCPNGINYCSNETAWASCCYDIYGTYTIDVNAAFNYLQNAGFYGDLPYIFLGLMSRESSFTPDVIAVCDQCCCTEIGVWAVGLLQFEQKGHFNLRGALTGIPDMSFERFTAWLKDPANNCAGAKYLYDNGGLGHWTPLQGVDSSSSIEYWRSRVAQGGGGTPTEPGISIANDIVTTPQPPPYDLPPAPETEPTPPQPYISPDILVPPLDSPVESFDGFDNLVRYYKRDLPHLVSYDQALIREITQLTGG